jgi:hypothetical protein
MAVGSSAADRAEPRRAHAFLAVQALGILSLATNSRWRNTNLDQDSLADKGRSRAGLRRGFFGVGAFVSSSRHVITSP